ncbi:sigma-70 family RNA polymerase sigma factor [Actinoplanes palleronii]|uniref:RNA polymerase sigma24 factor n=1 Tax=Actinoplanes palleronii TaxID=113570 RepID=A0ABQ4B5R5_9ACTN|nr:sigma-70 family RNA polymerase sigma factor [Actinoplanes palleronii]GIE65922.1 RNA polymerase sigma24 factor [Actinoplanes palleronii]
MDQHDEDEFRQFAVARLDDLRGLAYLACGDWQKAEDAASTALTKLYVNWRKVTSPHRYACRVVISSVMDESRRPWRREWVASAEALDRPEVNSVDRHSESLDVGNALRRLPSGQRAVLVLRFYGEFSVDEVAGILHKSAVTVESQTAHGLANLRNLLTEQDALPIFQFEERER